MHILSLGLNHTTAPVELRERLAFSEDQARAALARLGCGHGHLNSKLREVVIVSTCNRIEMYAVSNQKSFTELEAFLSDARGVSIEELRLHLYHYTDAKAVRHLFEVAAGLDSLVLGEPQILGQITRALELARGIGSSGSLLSRLFQSAIHAGKRARTETAISRNPASISSLAAGLCERLVHNIKNAQIVILGAGEMAELAVEALRKRGTEKVIVVNRTIERARTLADRWSAEADTFENLDKALVRADILIASTGAPHTLIQSEMVNSAMIRRSGRPLMFVDIAVPRDVDTEVADIPNVHLYDIDMLNTNLEQSLAERASEVPQVKTILADEESRFLEFLASLDMIPLIADMRQNAESIRQAELEKTLRRLPDLTDTERTRIDAMSQALVKKLLDSPTRRLRAEAVSPHATEFAAVARTLFDLQSKQYHQNDFGGNSPTTKAAD